MKRAFFLSLFVFLLTFSEKPPAQTLFASGLFKIDWKQIDGDTVEEARAALIRKGLMDEAKILRYAVTSWTISWNFERQKEERGIAKVTTNTAVRLSLPKLNPRTTMSPRDYGIWSRMYQGLLVHEFGHAVTPVRTARTIESVIDLLAGQRTLSALEANRIISSLIRENNRWDEVYDADTHHGALQGATLLNQGAHTS